MQLTLCVRFDSYCIFLAKLIRSIYGHDRMTNSLPETISVTLISFESGTMESSCWPFSVSLPSANIFSVCDNLNRRVKPLTYHDVKLSEYTCKGERFFVCSCIYKTFFVGKDQNKAGINIIIANYFPKKKE